MECDLTKLQAWVANPEDVADFFEIVKVVPGSRVGDAVGAGE